MKTGLFFPVIKQKEKKRERGGREGRERPTEDKSVKQVLATFDVQRKIASKT